MASAIRGTTPRRTALGLLTRRQLLVRSASTIAAASLAKPYLSRAADRPLIASGVQSGDVASDSAVIWARADRPSRMRLECSTVESFASIVRTASVDIAPQPDARPGLLVAQHI
jgi:alkaline phosphatase D